MTGADLRAIRHDLGLSQEALARELQVSSNTVARWEQGNRPIPRSLPLTIDGLRLRLLAREVERIIP